VAFHAHPDDEALLTGGTLARAAAAGHRVVLVVATAGERGLTDPAVADGLGSRRMRELERAAEALGVARVVPLGYEDSGFPETIVSSRSFASVPIETVAADVAEVLEEERADVLTTYDAQGGYGHPDHIHVHRVGEVAARLARTPVVLEATVPREAIQKAMRVIGRLGLRPGGFSAFDFVAAFTPKREITHVVDVRRWARQKRAAMAAHVSQAAGGTDVRTLALLLRLPPPLFRLVLGREWFVESGRPAKGARVDDVFATLREAEA
jgi:LmbE family N-acetylglucosaminyl deacetylase